MTGINTTLDIARQAIAANQYGLSVTGQNIANVDNTDYTRQLVELQNGTSVQIGNLVFGSGVDVTQIASSVDELLQTWMYDQQSTASAYEEMAANLSYIEDLLSLDSDNSLDSLFSDFWNSWSELSNTPDGTAERSGVLESGAAIVEQLNDMNNSMVALTTTVNNKIEVAVNSINGITSQIEELNDAIVAIEAQDNAIANDLRDQRTALVSELSGLLDISTYEKSDGTLLVSTANGSAILVSVGEARELSVSGGQILWESSGGVVDISDQISGGSIGGWLDIRDEVIPEYQAELDALTEAFVWNVNYQHSQGVGLSYLSDTVTGSYAVEGGNTGLLSSLDYAGYMDDSVAFTMFVQDAAGTSVSVSVNWADSDSLDTFAGDLQNAIDAAVGAGALTVSATADGQLEIQAGAGYSYAFNDASGLAAALGINTFFTGSSSEDIAVNTVISDTDLIAAGQVDATTGEIASGDNSNALLLAECGEISMEIKVYTYDRQSDPPDTASIITTTTDSYYQTMVSNLGIVTDSTERNLETAVSLMSELQEQRDTVSAVSLDEEMINLVKYQNAYNAASKLLTVADEMLDTIISTR